MNDTLEATDTLVKEEDTKSVFDEQKQVVLENNSWNSFDFVIEILCDFVDGMDAEQAEDIAWRIHETSQSIVYEGRFEDCKEIMVNINSSKEKSFDGKILDPPHSYIR